jgi:hypothetical protein
VFCPTKKHRRAQEDNTAPRNTLPLNTLTTKQYIHKAENEDDGLWNGAVPGGVQSVDRAAHLAALDAALAQPQGSYRWKIVVGHHTLLNYGSHGLDVTVWRPFL